MSFFVDAGMSVVTAYPMVAIGRVATERRSSADPQQMGEVLVNYLGLENIRSQTGELVNFRRREAQSIKSRSKIFKSENVLFGRLRPELNKVFLAHTPAKEGICSSEFIVLEPFTDRVHPRYLRHILASEFVTRFVSKLTVGAPLPRLSAQDLLSIEIPLPPLEVQTFLAARLEKIDAEISETRKHLQQLPVDLAAGLIQALICGSVELHT